MIELYELNPHKMTTLLEKKRNMYPGSLRQDQMFRPSETTEVSMEETHHHVLQFIYGTRNLWRQGQCSIQGGVGDQKHLKKTSSVQGKPFNVLL